MPSALEKIGKTPLVELKNIPSKLQASKIFAKADYLNPSGSIKDVMALYMVRGAESQGILKPGMEIIEVTTGNTGISFAMISAILSGSTGVPVTTRFAMSQFWQYSHVNVQPTKKIVCDGTSSDSSP